MTVKRVLLLDLLVPCKEPEPMELPEIQQVRLQHGIDHNYTTHHGVTFQRCGGGRRIIKKSRGA